jgi:hypothetical protein
MAFNIKRRGKITYYHRGDRPLFSHLVTEAQSDGDLRIHFAGFTGGESAARELGLPETAFMDPEREIPLVFQTWEKWLREAEICDSLADIDFLEMHVFGCQPKLPSPLVDPAGYAANQDRLRKSYANAYGEYFRRHLPENGLPARFTVHVVDVPDKAASYEFYGTALRQRSLNAEKK